MQGGGIITAGKRAIIPARLVQILERVIGFRGETEQPVSRRIGGDMRLLDTADRERGDDIFVRPLAGRRIFGIKGAFMLID